MRRRTPSIPVTSRRPLVSAVAASASAAGVMRPGRSVMLGVSSGFRSPARPDRTRVVDDHPRAGPGVPGPTRGCACSSGLLGWSATEGDRGRLGYAVAVVLDGDPLARLLRDEQART